MFTLLHKMENWSHIPEKFFSSKYWNWKKKCVLLSSQATGKCWWLKCREESPWFVTLCFGDRLSPLWIRAGQPNCVSGSVFWPPCRTFVMLSSSVPFAVTKHWRLAVHNKNVLASWFWRLAEACVAAVCLASDEDLVASWTYWRVPHRAIAWVSAQI